MSAETALMQLRFCELVIEKNVGEITHEESLRSFQPAGNSLNWVLGHLVATRSQLLCALGGEPVWSESECQPYAQHGPPLTDLSEARPLDEIRRAFRVTQTRLFDTVARLTPAELAQPLPPETPDVPAKTRGELLGVLGFHDAYHAGQTGLIRRLLGKPPADL